MRVQSGRRKRVEAGIPRAGMAFVCSGQSPCTPAPLLEGQDTVATGLLLRTVCTFYLCRLLADLV